MTYKAPGRIGVDAIGSKGEPILQDKVNQWGVDSRYQGYMDSSFLFCLVIITSISFWWYHVQLRALSCLYILFPNFQKEKEAFCCCCCCFYTTRHEKLMVSNQRMKSLAGNLMKHQNILRNIIFSLPLLEKDHDLKIWNISVEIIDKKYQ